MPESFDTLQPEEPAASAVVVEHAPSHHISFGAKWFSHLVLVPLVALATIFFGTISLLCGLWDASGRQQHFVARQWARTLLRIALSPMTLAHAERLHTGQAAVYVCNHLSYYDTPALFARLPFQFRILAKGDLWKVPFIGWYLARSGQVPVDRSSPRASIASLNKGVKTLEAGVPVVIFPEGGRAYNGELQPMVSGAAYMAIKAQVPLVPLTLVGTYELLPIHVYALRPRPLQLIVGEAISTAGMRTRDADALMQKAYDVIYKTYTEEHPA